MDAFCNRQGVERHAVYFTVGADLRELRDEDTLYSLGVSNDVAGTRSSGADCTKPTPETLNVDVRLWVRDDPRGTHNPLGLAVLPVPAPAPAYL